MAVGCRTVLSGVASASAFAYQHLSFATLFHTLTSKGPFLYHPLSPYNAFPSSLAWHTPSHDSASRVSPLGKPSKSRRRCLLWSLRGASPTGTHSSVTGSRMWVHDEKLRGSSLRGQVAVASGSRRGKEACFLKSRMQPGKKVPPT